MPGIFVQNAIFGSTTTAIGIADDLKTGIVDRFRSLPMARSAVLAGRTTADVMKNFILVVLVIVVGYLVGFKFQNGFIGAIALVILTLAVGFAFSWISATIALAAEGRRGRPGGHVHVDLPGRVHQLGPRAGHGHGSGLPADRRAQPHHLLGEPGARTSRSAHRGARPDTTTDSLEALLVKSAIWIVA